MVPAKLHGWGDSNLYLRRRRDQAATSGNPIALQLIQAGSALALRLLNSECSIQAAPTVASTPPARERIRNVLAAVDHPLSIQQLRNLSGMRTPTLCDCLAEMSRLGWVSRDSAGYRLTSAGPAGALSHSSHMTLAGVRV